jgi:hypothetical protein
MLLLAVAKLYKNVDIWFIYAQNVYIVISSFK